MSDDNTTTGQQHDNNTTTTEQQENKSVLEIKGLPSFKELSEMEAVAELLQQQQQQIEELRQQLNTAQAEKENTVKQAALKQLEAAGYNTKDFEKYTLEQVNAMLEIISQTNDKIVFERKKEEKPKSGFTVWNPETKKHEPMKEFEL